MRQDGSNSGLSTCMLASSARATAEAPIARRPAGSEIRAAALFETIVFMMFLLHWSVSWSIGWCLSCPLAGEDNSLEPAIRLLFDAECHQPVDEVVWDRLG